MTNISYDDFAKIDLRVAKIKKVEEIEGADKLYKLTLDLGKEFPKRTICAGIKEFYDKEDLKGKQIIIVANLEPRKMRGIMSEGMLLATDSENGPVLLIPEKKVDEGSKIK